MGIKEGEEVEAKEIHHIFNKLVIENFPNLEKVMPIQVHEASRTPNRLDKIELHHNILSLKQQAQRICKREKTNNI
jgi:hypothetical protein